MAHALAPDARKRHLDRTLFADDALVLHPLVLAAQAFVVLDRSKNTRAEQTIPLRLERAVVDRLGLFDFAVGPGQNLFRARDRNPDLVEDLRRHLRAEEIHDFLIHHRLLDRQSGPKFLGNGRRRGLPDCRWLNRQGRSRERRGAPLPMSLYSAASAFGPRSCLELCRSTLRPSERISFTSTLN